MFQFGERSYRDCSILETGGIDTRVLALFVATDVVGGGNAKTAIASKAHLVVLRLVSHDGTDGRFSQEVIGRDLDGEPLVEELADQIDSEIGRRWQVEQPLIGSSSGVERDICSEPRGDRESIAPVEHRNEVVETQTILLELWGDDTFFNNRSLQVFITKLRHRLSHDPQVRIVNVRAIGYKLIAP